MKSQTKYHTDLTVRSFAYMARQLACSPVALAPSAQYERILGEAERHRSALRLMQRDAFEMANLALRSKKLTEGQFHRTCERAAKTVEQAQGAINRIAAQYAPQRIAA